MAAVVDLIATLHLKILTHFESTVHHIADAECNRTRTQIKTTKMCVFLLYRSSVCLLIWIAYNKTENK